MDNETIRMIRVLIEKNLADKRLRMLEKIERTDLKAENEIEEYRKAYDLRVKFNKFIDEQEDEDG